MKRHIITRQGIAHPLAASATLPAVSPVFVSCSVLPCRNRLLRRGFSAATPSAFLSCLRLIETPTGMMVIHHFEREVHYHIENDGVIPMSKSFRNYHSDRKVISRIAESQYSVVKRLGLWTHLPIREDCPSAALQNRVPTSGCAYRVQIINLPPP